MQEYIKENVQFGELAVYRVLTNQAPQYNSRFLALELPYALAVDAKNRRLVLPHYEGADFNARWDQKDGGSLMPVDFVKKAIDVIADLSLISTNSFTEDVRLQTIPELVFDHDQALSYYASLLEQFRKAGLICSQDVTKAHALLKHKQMTSLIVNNGDFYPRNFIERPDGRMLLLDWETWNPHSPFFIIDHPENVAAVMYVHMWGNPAWQKAYRTQLMARFGLDEKSLSKGIVMKALQLANLWFGRPHRQKLVTDQMSMCREELQKCIIES